MNAHVYNGTSRDCVCCGTRKLGVFDVEAQEVRLTRRQHGEKHEWRLDLDDIVTSLDPFGTTFRRIGSAAT